MNMISWRNAKYYLSLISFLGIGKAGCKYINSFLFQQQYYLIMQLTLLLPFKHNFS